MESYFPEYPKIETLFNRNPEDMKKVLPGVLRLPEFGLVNTWLVTEKVDGTNIRVLLTWEDEKPVVRFGGRTSAAQIQTTLLDYLAATFTIENLTQAFEPDVSVVLYGEGYGPKIQKCGGLYRSDVSFRLFDVAVIGEKRTWWLTWDNVVDVSMKLGIDTVPYLALEATTDQAIALVAGASATAMSDGGEGCEQEGIVARTDPYLHMRNGRRVVWKLKARDL